jgi:pimeloyl-ACP methyl ester carboxylesterase
MGISHWADAAHRDAYWAAYRASVELWPIPQSSVYIETPHGQTHVLVSGTTKDAPVVLLHAASLSATQWYLQAAALGAQFQLYAVDIMGDIGRSTQTQPIHSRADAAAWLSAVMDGLALDSAAFVGSSFGGFLSTNLATLCPERVRALVLLAPAATLQPFSPLAKLFIRMGSLVPLPGTVRPGLKAMMGGKLPDERLVRQMEIGVTGFRYDHRCIFPEEISDAELQSLSCPTLALIGEQERIYDPRAAATRARQLIRGADVELVPELGHLLGMQRPELITPRIARFLEMHLQHLRLPTQQTGVGERTPR